MKKRRTAICRGIAAVMAFLLLVTVSASTLMFQFAGAINAALNTSTNNIFMLTISIPIPE